MAESDTVEVPANAKIKQLANDVKRDGNEYAVPLLLDFYEILSALEEDEQISLNDITLDEQKSDVPIQSWRRLLERFVDADILERHPGSPDRYSLNK